MVAAGNTNATTFTLAEHFEYAALANDASPGAGMNVFNNVSVLIGNSANNLLLGNVDSNTIMGGLGNDTLAGFGGDDLLTGGAGADLFALSISAFGGGQFEAGFGGQITDFNLTGASEGDRLLLNFKANTGPNMSQDYAYSFNGGADFGNTVEGAPRAILSYDAGTGLLEIQLQQSVDNGWAFNSMDNTPDITYLVTGASDTAAAALSEASFIVDSSNSMGHPMVGDAFWSGARHF
jgi:Ca2+-binding RTX toxin-like protein